MSTSDNNAVLLRAIARFNDESTRSDYLQLYDEDVIIHGFPPGLPAGLAGLRQYYEMLWEAFPDGKVSIEDVVSEGEKLAARYIFAGTHQGEFLGIAPTNRQVTMSGMTILRMSNGKCVERWNERDSLGLMRQLGVIGEG